MAVAVGVAVAVAVLVTVAVGVTIAVAIVVAVTLGSGVVVIDGVGVTVAGGCGPPMRTEPALTKPLMALPRVSLKLGGGCCEKWIGLMISSSAGGVQAVAKVTAMMLSVSGSVASGGA